MHAGKLFVAACFLLNLLAGGAIATDKYIGVESCAASSCHGAKSARDQSNVSQNEYTTWFRFDQHSRAQETLHSPAASKITQALGQLWPWENKVCLSCHSNNVANELTSASYSPDDGITCEACHGPAEKWGPSHHLGKPNTPKPKSIWETEQEAATCLGCHSASTAKPLNHRIMAAGHPSLSFELVTFSQMQPAHVAYDADYIERKAKPSEINRWFAGQFVTAKHYLSMLEQHIPASQTLVPDGALFNCQSCHQPALRPQAIASLNPGSLQPESASLQMILIAAEAAEWEHAIKLKGLLENWATSTSESKSAFLAATGKLWHSVKMLSDDQRFRDSLISDEIKPKLASILGKQVAEGKIKYWASAEQAYYLLGLSKPQTDRQGLLNSLASPKNFNPELFQAEFSELD